jgi:KUP system potassium uptake protein
VLGVAGDRAQPARAGALNPAYAVRFFVGQRLPFLALGSVVLAVTGGEALYTDMGHFGKKPRSGSPGSASCCRRWCSTTSARARCCSRSRRPSQPLLPPGPEWALIPMVVLATLATVIASQAVISGAFSVARQAVQMGYCRACDHPHLRQGTRADLHAVHQLDAAISRCRPRRRLQESSNLAAAYGIAVTGTMLIDTILLGFVMVLLWKLEPRSAGDLPARCSARRHRLLFGQHHEDAVRAAGSRSSSAWCPSR